MEENFFLQFDKNFILVDPNTKITPAHLCIVCNFVGNNIYQCFGQCNTYCKNHAPLSCPKCEGELYYAEMLDHFVKKQYKIKCQLCDKEMMLEDQNSHLQNIHQNSIKCKLNCGKLFDSEIEIESHLKENCINSKISCSSCKKIEKRQMILVHEKNCKIELEENTDSVKIFFSFYN